MKPLTCVFTLATAIGSLTAGPLVTAPSHAGEGPARKPNILFLFIDDMGYADPSCFGNPSMQTPRIDRLAKEGIRLTNFYVNSPICSPSRVAVTTGQYPFRWKIHSYLNSRAVNRSRQMADYLDPTAPTTARVLKADGYATAHFGKWHMGGGRDVNDAPLPRAYGFDESLVSFEGLGDRILPPGGLSAASAKLGRGSITHVQKHEMTGIYVDRAIDFMRRQADAGRPFYLRVFPNDVHDGHDPAPGQAETWAPVTKNPFEQRFFAVLHELDTQLGRLFDAVDALGLAEYTLILFTSDNGPTDWPSYYQKGWKPPGFTGPFYGRKWCLFEGGIRMPFIARWTGRIKAGTTDDTTVMCAIDLSPTICALAGVTSDTAKLDGHDMSPALLGRPTSRPEPVFWQYGGVHAKLKPGNPDFVSPSLAVRDGDWKLLAEPDGSSARLYNLQTDPGETMNLLTSEPERAAVLFSKIRAWGREMGFDTQDRPLRPPAEPLHLLLAGKRRRLENKGAVRTGKGGFTFDGKSCLDVARKDAPDIAKKTITIAVTIDGAEADGVILAQGGNRMGYSLYVKNGRPAFTTCIDWIRTTISATAHVTAGQHVLKAELGRGGTMCLSVDGVVAAQGKAPGLFPNNPGDSLQIGADTVQPVGEYAVDNGFRGTISHLTLETR